MKTILKWLVCFYQKTLSVWLGPCCRFYPSCSHYALEALEKYSIPRALVKICWRLLRCGPWSKGGHDPA